MASRQVTRDDSARLGLTFLPLGRELAGDKPDRHDPVPLGGGQQSPTCALPRRVVLELDLGEAGQRVTYMRLVVDRQVSPALRVHVGERGVREVFPGLAAELCHPILMLSDVAQDERRRLEAWATLDLRRTGQLKQRRMASTKGPGVPGA